MIIFKRERTPIELVIYGIYTYSRSNSFRLSRIALIDETIFQIREKEAILWIYLNKIKEYLLIFK